MTKSRLHDYRNVHDAPPARRATRRVAALVVLAVTVVAGTVVLRSLGESTAQLRILLRGAAPQPGDSAAAVGAAIEEPRTATPAQLAESAPVAATDDAYEPAGAPAAEPQLPQATGPMSGDEFARLLEAELSSESDPEALEDLRRALRTAAAP